MFASRNIKRVYNAQEWEMVVLQALKWDVAAVTAGDFVDVILCQLSMVDVDEQSERGAVVRHHAHTYVIVAALGITTNTLLSILLVCRSFQLCRTACTQWRIHH